MRRQITIWAIHSVIVLPILVFTLITSQPSKSGTNEDEVAVANWQVYSTSLEAVYFV